MAFSYITEENVFKRYQAAKKYTDALTVPFPEFQRIASNKPFEGLDPAYPDITDGTTASIIRKTPRRVVQQIPTGKVVTDDGGWLGIVADFILTHKILPYANEEYDLIQKCWTCLEDGLTFGSAFTYTPFLNHDGYFCPDVIQLYWGDIAIQPGKKSLYSCNYFFMRSWWQPEDIEALIDKETSLADSAKKRGEKYESTWDLTALKEAKDHATSKDQQAKTPTEDERAVDSSGIELITAFQKGVGAMFYTFASKGELIVRTEENKDPRGKFPIDAMYGDVDGTNPLGRGLVELIGPLQNFIDSEMQLHGYNHALMLAPTLLKYGTVNKSKIKIGPNVVIDMGADPNGKVVPLEIDTTALKNYPALYGLHKSQLLNLVNSPDTSISSEIGNPSFSKTTAGVNQQQASISVDDNYVRKMFEAWFEHWCETAINLYFAKRSGIDELQLDKETAMRLRELPDFDESLLSPENLIRIDYDTDTPALKFRVNPSTTSVKDQAAQVQDATNLLDLVMKYPQLNSNYGGPIDTDVLARRIVSNSGIDDPEQVAPEPSEAQKQSKEQQKNTVSPFSPMFENNGIKGSYADLPPAAQVQWLSMHGINVGINDVLAGPVVDPNMRGVTNPVNAPNEQLPGGGTPGVQPMAQNPLQQDGINLTPQEMQRLQQDPRFAQQQPQQPPQEPPLVGHLKQLGLSPEAIQQVVNHTLQHANGAQNG